MRYRHRIGRDGATGDLSLADQAAQYGGEAPAAALGEMYHRPQSEAEGLGA